MNYSSKQTRPLGHIKNSRKFTFLPEIQCNKQFFKNTAGGIEIYFFITLQSQTAKTKVLSEGNLEIFDGRGQLIILQFEQA